MARKLTEKKLQSLISDKVSSRISGIQFDVMDLGKLTDAGVAAYKEHNGDEAKVLAAIDSAIAQFRKN